MNERIEKALNEQINREYFSSYLYLSMAAYCESASLKGAAHWMKMQAKEEMFHIMKFFDYICDRDGRVQLKGIEAPALEWKSAQHVFEEALKHEKFITSCISDLMALAAENKDSTTQVFLQWFINEQIEEEAAAKQIVDQLKLMGNAPGGLYLLDRELATRPAPVDPSTQTAPTA